MNRITFIYTIFSLLCFCLYFSQFSTTSDAMYYPTGCCWAVCLICSDSTLTAFVMQCEKLVIITVQIANNKRQGNERYEKIGSGTCLYCKHRKKELKRTIYRCLNGDTVAAYSRIYHN